MLVSYYFVLLFILATGCLAANTRVLNGKPAKPHQFPYHIGIYWKTLDESISKLRYVFGGAIVSDKWVLTTAYYNDYPNESIQLYVKAGKHIVDEEEDSEQIRLVLRYFTHPEYKLHSPDGSPIARHDLALLQVKTPFIFNEYVRAAGIPSASAYFESGSLAGWGSIGIESNVRKYAKELHYDDSLLVIGAQDCADAINKVASTYGFLPVKISSNQTCSGSGGGKSGARLGDAGSAFVHEIRDEYDIIGIVSTTTLPSVIIDRPTVYTRVGAYSEWINKIIESS